jgi:hypothetical protein
MSDPIPLRGGYAATDPRLGRLPEFDERSRQYPIRAMLEANDRTQLRSKSWSLRIWLDQQRTAACVGMSRTEDLDALPVRVQKPNGDLLDEEFAFALYKLAQQYDQWAGENYEGSSVIGGLRALKALGYVGEYRWAFSLNDLMLALAWVGPSVLGTVWLNSMFIPKPSGLLVVDFASGEAGGHAYIANSIKVTRQAKRAWLGPDEPIRDEPLILGRNSWGRGWGKDGHWAMWASDVQKLLDADGEASIVTKAFRKA